MQTLHYTTIYYNAFGSLAGIILIGDQCVPGLYLLFWQPSWIWYQDDPKHDFNTRNGFVALKLVGLEVLHKFLCYLGQNLGIPLIQDSRRTPFWITEKKPTQRMTENHRLWTLGTFKQLYWENQLSIFFYHFKPIFYLMLLGYMSSFVYHIRAIGEFKLELQSGNG